MKSALNPTESCCSLYRRELRLQAEWLARTAQSKVDSIQILLSRNDVQPSLLLELGCGTGAVIQGCRQRQLARRYAALDLCEEAVRYLRGRCPDIQTVVADITCPALRFPVPVDLVVLSHVLEHLRDPSVVLASLVRHLDFRHAILEVPLEDLWLLRTKAALFGRAKKAGHVSFFTPGAFVDLLRSSGLTVLDSRKYVPVLDVPTLKSMCAKDDLSPASRLLKYASMHCLPRYLTSFWGRFYYAHLAVLCRKS